MTEEQSETEATDQPVSPAKTPGQTRKEMLEKVQKARESRMRHQNPLGDEDGQKTSRNNKGYGGRPAPRGNSQGGAPVRKKDAG